jgi:hypothetical protein
MAGNVVRLDTDPSGTLVPPAGLVALNPKGEGPTLFCLFTKDWLKLQTFIVQALTLPISINNFEASYGTFKDEQEITNCVNAMKTVQALSVDFGDPTALIKQLASDPTILQSDTAPIPVYTHIVWFATKLYLAATMFNQTLSQFMTLLDPKNCGSKQECAAVLKEVLTGPGGLQSTAEGMVSLANDLVKALAQFNEKLAPATGIMASYTSKATQFYKDVEDAITTDITDVATYQKQADDAYKLWEDLTISAVTTSVGLLIVTGGLAWPASAVLGGVLGDAAKKARDSYDNACKQRDAANEDEKKKIKLKTDLDGFDKQMIPVNTAAQDFMGTLQQVTAVWALIGVNIKYISDNFTPDKLDNLSSLMQALALDRATKDWKTIADKAEEYTGNSLVSYQIVPFGDPLPNLLVA